MKRGGVIFRAPTETPQERERQAIERAQAKRHRHEAAEASSGRPGPPTCGDPDCDYCQGYVEDSIITPSDPYEVRKIVAPKGRKLSDAVGKRSTSRTKSSRGRYVRSVPWEKGRDIAIDATLFAAAAGGHVDRVTHRVRIGLSDLRGKQRERKVGNLVLVVMDASGSMETQQRMVATKGAVLSLLRTVT